MLVKEKVGHIDDFEVSGRAVDLLMLEWHETGKRIMHKVTTGGRPVTLKFLGESDQLRPGDIIYTDEHNVIIIDVFPCEVIIIQVNSMYEMAAISYEIGNKHLPLFFENNDLLVPFDKSLLRLLSSAGYNIKEGYRKLINPLKTTVSPHASTGSSKSLFSLILNRTTPNE